MESERIAVNQNQALGKNQMWRSTSSGLYVTYQPLSAPDLPHKLDPKIGSEILP